MSEASALELLVAFGAGFCSFFLPCFLPLLPAYFSFISGVSLGELREPGRAKRVVVINTLFFISGFSLVFIIMGASATYFGTLLHDYQDWLRIAGGIVVIILGLFMLGVVRPGFLARERRIHLGSKPAGFLGSAVVGAAFAAGWTPCFGPVVGSMLVKASTSETVSYGILLLSCYSVGLALPLLLSALFIERVLKRFSSLTRHLKTFSVICGIILILMGIVLLTGDPLHLIKKY